MCTQNLYANSTEFAVTALYPSIEWLHRRTKCDTHFICTFECCVPKKRGGTKKIVVNERKREKLFNALSRELRMERYSFFFDTVSPCRGFAALISSRSLPVPIVARDKQNLQNAQSLLKLPAARVDASFCLSLFFSSLLTDYGVICFRRKCRMLLLYAHSKTMFIPLEKNTHTRRSMCIAPTAISCLSRHVN